MRIDNSLPRWARDPYWWGLAAAAFLFAAFLSQGLPYWDVDFTINFAAAFSHSLARLIGDWLSPVSSGESWGFLDRAAQFIVYRICYAIAGYDTWPYVLFKCACYAGLAIVMYLWGLRMAPVSLNGRRAALAATAFFWVAPGPVASLVWLADFAPAAELAFLVLTFVIWWQIESTPAELTGAEMPRWLLKWTGLSLAVYLGYKTKADLKAIPLIVAIYVLAMRRTQWKLFAIPVTLMMLLAVPWRHGIFTTLPPFVPGSGAAPTAFMWSPARLSVLGDFIWSSGDYDFKASLGQSPFSLAGLLGPFLLIAIAGFLYWRLRLKPVDRETSNTPVHRARVFVLIWLGLILAATSALPSIPDFFRIRYGILTLVPVCILLAGVFDWFLESFAKLPRWASVACIVLFLAQAGVNVNRSIQHRVGLGRVMTAIDRVYEYVDRNAPNGELALLPDFLSYDYRLNAGRAVRNRDRVASTDDLVKRHTPDRTLVISWQRVPVDRLSFVEQFSGCRPSTLFDRLMPCPPGTGAVLMRYTRVNGALVDEVTVAEKIAKQTQKPEDYLNLSLQYQKHERYEEGIAAAREALRLRPGYAEAYNNIAAGYEALKMWDPAIEAARQALRLKPDFQLARNNLEWSLSQKKSGGP